MSNCRTQLIIHLAQHSQLNHMPSLVGHELQQLTAIIANTKSIS